MMGLCELSCLVSMLNSASASALPLVLEEPLPEHPFSQSEAEDSPERGRLGGASVRVIPVKLLG